MKLFLPLILLITMTQDSAVIADFKNDIGTSNWYVLDDGVMGGLSQGKLQMSEAGNAWYTGTVRTENNGGFSSVRHRFEAKQLSRYTQLKLRLKGDGKAYQFRIKEKLSQRYSYIQVFETTGEWEEISLPLDQFYPGYRGYQLDMPNFAGELMEEVAILIGNKKEESFSVEIEKIYLE